MMEARYFIADVSGMKRKLEEQGAVFRGSYSFTDAIYAESTAKPDFNKDFIHLRVITKTNLTGKKCVLVRKVTGWGGAPKKAGLFLGKNLIIRTMPPL